MAITRMQQLMVEDGAPLALFISDDERRASWEANPPRPIPAFSLKPRDEDAATAAFRAQVEEERRQKSRAQIVRMKNRFVSKAIDYTRMRWDQRRGKFVPDAIPAAKSAPAFLAPQNIAERLPKREPARAGADTKALEWERGIRKTYLPATAQRIVNRQAAAQEGWSRVKAHNARALAELNGVWDDKYTKLSGGLLVMTVTNRLKGLVKKGEAIRWA